MMTMTRVQVLLASLQKRVLDVGGSAGTLHEELAKRFPPEELISLDIEILHVRTNQVVGDGQQMPFGNGVFKSVLAGETIEHIADYRKFLRECRRVLEWNGVLALSTPNVASWFNRLTHSYEHPLHVSLFTPAQLKRVLEEEGFTVQSIQFFPFTPESSDGAKAKWLFPIRALVNGLLPPSLREDIVVIARKTPLRLVG